MYDNIFVLIPTFEPSLKLYKVLDNLKDAGFKNVVIVDDGRLKTGFKYIFSLNCDGVITVDDDLQQDISDIKAVADKFLESRNVVLGVRTFDKTVPFKRRLANKSVAFIFNMKYKTKISDTQTGLRCFPKKILNDLCEVSGSGFEYEINVLKYLAANNIQVDFVPIKTIYNDEVSRYKDLKDSYKIIKAILEKNKK